jgi:putative membrane protein
VRRLLHGPPRGRGGVVVSGHRRGGALTEGMIMRVLRVAVVSVAAAALLAVPMHASAQGELSEQDRTFLVQSHQGNLAEIAAGEAAQQQAVTDLVRRHGEILITDHTALDQALQPVAQRLGVELPTAPTAEQQAELAAVKAKHGEAFDQAWTASQIAAHEKTLALGQQEMQNGTNSEVIALAKAAAPVIEKHLAMLRLGHVPVPKGVDAGIGGPAGQDHPITLLGTLIATCGLALAAAAATTLRRSPRPRHGRPT